MHVHPLDHGDAEAQFRAHVAQQSGVALAGLAEAEVVADDHVADAQAADQDVRDKVPGGRGGEAGVEIQDGKTVDPEGGHEVGLDLERGQAEQRQVGAEVCPGVRFEDHDRHRAGDGRGGPRGRLQHRLMAAVDPVEISDGDGTPATSVRTAGTVAKDFHQLSSAGPQAGGHSGGRLGTFLCNSRECLATAVVTGAFSREPLLTVSL